MRIARYLARRAAPKLEATSSAAMTGVSMLDAIYILIGLAFFVGAGFYLVACDHL